MKLAEKIEAAQKQATEVEANRMSQLLAQAVAESEVEYLTQKERTAFHLGWLECLKNLQVTIKGE